MILVTGFLGFIGSNFVHLWLASTGEPLDKLTDAGNLANLHALKHDPRHTFVRGGISDRVLVHRLLREHQPRAVINFAAESHVDRSIHMPDDIVQTNVLGIYALLESARNYWMQLAGPAKREFRFLQVSTDEVYGSLTLNEAAFAEANAFKPNSPYSASKAASDHFVCAWHHTCGLPVEKPNLTVVKTVCAILDKAIPRTIKKSYAVQIAFSKDRPGRDRRYAVNACKIAKDLNWAPQESLESDLKKAVQWYLDNAAWVQDATSGACRQWTDKQYGV